MRGRRWWWGAGEAYLAWGLVRTEGAQHPLGLLDGAAVGDVDEGFQGGTVLLGGEHQRVRRQAEVGLVSLQEEGGWAAWRRRVWLVGGAQVMWGQRVALEAWTTTTPRPPPALAV